jgi:hypothetical protein
VRAERQWLAIPDMQSREHERSKPMRLSALQAASLEAQAMQRLRDHRETIENMVVTGIKFGTSADDHHQLDLTPFSGGGGRLSSLGFPLDLRNAIHTAVLAWIDGEIKKSEGLLSELGVEIGA